MSTETTATWPRVEAVIKDDGTGEVSIGGTVHQIRTGSLPDARTAVISLVAQTADKLGRRVRASMSDPDGDWPLIIHADGTVEPDDAAEAKPRQRPEASTEPESEDKPASEVSSPESTPEAEKKASLSPGDQDAAHQAPGWVRSAEQQAETAATVTSYPSRRERRQSFLTQEQAEEPATKGWRGSFTRMGIRMSPNEAERAERADVQAVSQHWPGPRTIAIVNGKGGAGKTPSTALLAAVFARYGGAGVLTWDNNQTRGTLGWRTEQGPHEATLLELLPQVERLLSTGAQSADLAHYVHHQTRDRFDVLRSKPMELASAQRVDAEDVDSIHQVASKYYRLIFIDSGNDESDPMWRRMIDHTDQLVVATTTRDDHAEAGALLLEALAERDERSARLAEQAVVIVNQADPKAHASDLTRVATGYRDLAREAITIPHDPAMVDGVLRYGSLRPATQRAWLAAGAAVARGL
ncbi:MinD-like ATPase involved in chromosome partitioning or flagellar assembly [Arthrobacter sp. PL16]|uniref:AAA family ATPase n=1 Tax=Arthrobacter sp. PL16 TaxID=3071720 RepID=UPI002E09726F|nr:MinD-like ATPase involved in chromosome partitioning or flagellar assembly [Arthrobacter sp. PL16]